jgi:hypothetical protein
MAFLDKAKEHSKKKKHPAAEAPPSADEESQSDESAAPEGGGAQDSESEPPSQGGTAAGAGAGGTPDAPQAGGNQPTGSAEDQGSDEDSDSDQDQDGSGGPQGGDDSDSGGQDGSPGGGSDDSTSQALGGQDPGDPSPAQAQGAAAAAGGSLQEFKDAVGPDGEPDFSKIPLPPALSAELDKAKDALNQALYQNEKVARAVIQAVVPGQQLPAAAAHMTLVIVSSINKKLLFSKNAPQLVLPIVQLTLNHILDMVEQVRKAQIPDNQAVGALGLAQEGVMRMFGVSKQQVANLKSHLPPSMVSKYQAHYKNAHAYATQGQQGSAQGASGGPPGGAAPQGPAGGPEGASQGSTPSQAPGGAAPPSGGGMVSQGAQAAQGGAEPSGPSQEEQEEQE